MPFPDPTGWAPNSVTSPITGGPGVPDWTTPEIWERALAEAQMFMGGEFPQGYNQGVYRTAAAARNSGDVTSLANAIAAQYTSGGQYGNSELARVLGPAAVGGGGLIASLAGSGAVGAGAAAAADGLTPITTGASYLPGGVPSVAGASMTGGPTAALGVGAGTAAGVAGGAASAIPNWLDYALPGVNTLLGAYGANEAADAQTDALGRAIDENARQYDTTRGDLMPWLDAGRGALERLQDPSASFMASPDYEFRRNEGQRDILNSFAARGGAQSGNALRALTEYNSNLASGEFNDWWNRQAGLSGIGQTTGTQLGTLGANSANVTGNYLAGQGNARASGVLGRTNAVQNGIYDAYSNYLYRRRA